MKTINIFFFAAFLVHFAWPLNGVQDGQLPAGQLINDAPFPIYVVLRKPGKLFNYEVLSSAIKMNRGESARFEFDHKNPPQIIIATEKIMNNNIDLFIFSFDTKKSFETAYVRFAKIEKKFGTEYTLAAQLPDKSKTKGIIAKKYYTEYGFPLNKNVKDEYITLQHISFAKYESKKIEEMVQQIDSLEKQNFISQKKWPKLLEILGEPMKASYDSVRNNWKPEEHSNDFSGSYALYNRIATFIEALNPLLTGEDIEIK
jgi:hypothetical protein